MLIATIDSLPGYELRICLGAVMGTGAKETPLFGGPLLAQRNAMRDVALRSLLQAAAARGANAVVGLYYVDHFIGKEATIVDVHATAVRAVPVTPEAVEQYGAMVRAGQAPSL